jgi:hypothetical protein
MIGLTPGNLITHLRKLEDADYIATEKTGYVPASLTTVALTPPRPDCLRYLCVDAARPARRALDAR